jgi:hypothetical protein
MKKLLVVGVIGLFLGLACAPSINANVSKENKLVEITTEICGMNGGKKTGQLSREEAEEVDRLFDNIKEKLDKVKTRDEADRIFEKAIVELDKLGLLGGLSVGHEKNLINGEFYKIRQLKSKENFLFIKEENLDCLIAGKTNHTYFVEWREPSSIISRMIVHIGNFLISVLKGPLEQLVDPLLLMLELLYKRIPLKRNVDIAFGTDYYTGKGGFIFPASGWVWTQGDNGIVEWDGTYYGQLGERDVFLFTHSYAGAINFSGVRIKILHPFFGFPSYYFGYAKHVSLDYTIPKP